MWGNNGKCKYIVCFWKHFSVSRVDMIASFLLWGMVVLQGEPMVQSICNGCSLSWFMSASSTAIQHTAMWIEHCIVCLLIVTCWNDNTCQHTRCSIHMLSLVWVKPLTTLWFQYVTYMELKASKPKFLKINGLFSEKNMRTNIYDLKLCWYV